MKTKVILTTLSSMALLGQSVAAVFVTGPSSGSNIAGGDTLMTGFVPTQDYTVYSLGAFANSIDGQTVTLGNSITVTLWDTDGAIASAVVNGGTVSGGFVFTSISPITLTSGQSYAITASGYQAGTPFGDSPTYGITTSFAQDATFTNPSNPLGSASYTGSLNYSFASFSTTAVPEPEVYAALTGLALVGFGLYRRQVAK